MSQMSASQGGHKHVEDSNIRDLVENCITTDDLTPLLRFVFDTEAGSADGYTPAERKQAVLGVHQCLKNMAAEQDRIIQDICHANAVDIAECVAEMDRMQTTANDLRGTLKDTNAALQGAGGVLVQNAHTLNELMGVQFNVIDGVAAVQRTKHVLQMCVQVGSLLEQRRLYQALRLIEDIRKEHLSTLLGMLSASAQAPTQSSATSPNSCSYSHGGASSSPAAATNPNPAKKLANVAGLQAFFDTLIEELLAAVEQLAIGEFNSWLVAVRAQARTIGMRAIRKAAIERQLGDDLARERKAVMLQLGSGSVLQDVASAAVRAPFRQEIAQDSAAAAPAAAAGAGTGPAAARGPAAAGPAAPAGASAPGLNDNDVTAPGTERARGRRKLQAAARHSSSPAGIPAGMDQAAPGSTISTSMQPTTSPPLLAIKEILAAARAMQQQQQQQQSSSCSSAAAGRDGGPTASTSSGSTGGSGSGNDSAVGLLSGVDMQGLLRCIHVHKVLGRLPRFSEYYLEQRRLQVTTDLAQPHSFLELYQPYLAQVAGFFIIESHVQRLAGVLAQHPQALLLWEGAASSLKDVLEGALEGITSAPIMALIKDFVLLVCGALGACGYSTAAIESVLLNGRSKYHELLMTALASRVGRAMDSDTLDDLTVRSEAMHRDLVLTLGLPAKLEGAGDVVQRPPYMAPFSSCVPALLHAVRGFVTDSLSYLRGLLKPWELMPALFYHRNRMMTKSIMDAMLSKVSQAAQKGSVRGCMKMAANVWSLLQAQDVLDDWTLLQGKQQQQQQDGVGGLEHRSADAAGRPEGGRRYALKAAAAAEALTSGVQASLRSVQDAAEQSVLRLVLGRVSAVMASVRSMAWLPPGPLPSGTSAHVQELLAYLQETFDMAHTLLPRSSFLFLCRTVVKSISNSYMKLFSLDGIAGYNLFAIERLAQDMAALQSFASSCAATDLGQEFAAPVQLCKLLLSNAIEDVLIPDLRKQRYPNLELPVVVLVLDKYCEASKVGKERTSFPAKKTVAGIAKQLRGHLVTGGEGPKVLQDF